MEDMGCGRGVGREDDKTQERKALNPKHEILNEEEEEEKAETLKAES